MKKWIFYTIIILLIALISTPWIEGMLFKSKYLHLIEVINQDNRAQIKVMSYKQGWLHSRAKIFVTLNKSLIKLYQISISQANTPIGFTIEEKITHGPFIYDRFSNTVEFGHAKIQNDIRLPKEIKTNFLGSLISQDVLTVDLISKFDGNWSGEILIPTITLSIPDFGELTWLGLNGQFNIVLANNYFKYTNFEARLGSFAFKGDSQNPVVKSIETDQIKYRYNASYDEIGLYSGFTSAYTHSISILKADDTSLIGQHIAIHTAFNMDRNTFYAGNISLNIKNLILSSNVIPDIKPLHVLITARNFNIKGLLSYIDSIQLNTPDAVKSINIGTSETLLMHMIMPESIFQGDLSITTDIGSLTSHFRSTLRMDVPPPSTLRDFIASLSTTANFVISPSLMPKIVELCNDKITTTKTSQGTIAQIITSPQNTTPPTLANKISPISNQPGSQPNKQSPQQIVDDLLLGGYLSKDDNNNYTTELTVKSGVWKLNNRIVNY